MSTPVLPEAVPDIDANPVFSWRRGYGEIKYPRICSLVRICLQVKAAVVCCFLCTGQLVV